MSARQLRAAVLGYPIAHSLSPRIHNYWIALYGLQGAYEARAVPPTIPDLERVLSELQREGYDGCNLTVPLKELVLQLPGYSSTPRVTQIGAANTVVLRNPALLDNTDIYGVAHAVAAMGATVGSDSRVLVLGAGGAARAAAVWAHSTGAALTIANRSVDRATALCHTLQITAATLDLSDTRALQEAYASHDVTIQSTSAELDAQADLHSLLPRVALQGKYCLDMVYSQMPADPAQPLVSTRWSLAAANCGATAEDGLHMLVAQAAKSFELWTGLSPDPDATLAWLRQSLHPSSIAQ